MLLALTYAELPENVALIVDSRIAFYKVTEWMTHIHTKTRLTGAAGFAVELIERLNQRGVTVHWLCQQTSLALRTEALHSADEAGN